MSGKRTIVVIGGNGFVGSAICAALVRRQAPVVSISRSGVRPAHLRGGDGCWSDAVRWEAGDARDPSTFAGVLAEARAVVLTAGSPPLPFVDFELQRSLNATANVATTRAARDAGVERLVLVNATMPAWLDSVAGGYAQGKRDAADAVPDFVTGRTGTHAAVLKPSAIYGTRYERTSLGTVPVPLGLVMGPVSAALRFFGGTARALRGFAPYLLDGALLAPVPVEGVAAAAVHHVLDAAADGQVAVEDAEALLATERPTAPGVGHG